MLDVLMMCLELSRPLPNVPDRLCNSVHLQASEAKTVQNRPILMRDVKAEAPRKKVLVLGGIHGDERSSSSLLFHWIGFADQIHTGYYWRFIPALNPDGLLKKTPTRYNERGVDLNRNFPTGNWEQTALKYWIEKTGRDPRRYPGKSSLSEPESVFLNAQVKAFAPDVIVSIHAPLGLLDFDGPATPPSRLGRLYLDQVGIYPGSLGHYGGINLGIPVVTIELPSADKTPSAAEMRQMWLDLIRWLEAHPAHSSARATKR